MIHSSTPNPYMVPVGYLGHGHAHQGYLGHQGYYAAVAGQAHHGLHQQQQYLWGPSAGAGSASFSFSGPPQQQQQQHQPSVLVILPPAYQKVDFERVLDLARSAFQLPNVRLDDLNLRFAWVAEVELTTADQTHMYPPSATPTMAPAPTYPGSGATATETTTTTRNYSYQQPQPANGTSTAAAPREFFSHPVQKHFSRPPLLLPLPPSQQPATSVVTAVTPDMHHVVLSNLSPSTSEDHLLHLIVPFRTALAGFTLAAAPQSSQSSVSAAFGFRDRGVAESCYGWLAHQGMGDAAVVKMAAPGVTISVRLYHPAAFGAAQGGRAAVPAAAHYVAMPQKHAYGVQQAPVAKAQVHLKAAQTATQIAQPPASTSSTAASYRPQAPPAPQQPPPPTSATFQSPDSYRAHVEASYKWIEATSPTITPATIGDVDDPVSPAQQVLAASQSPMLKATVTEIVSPMPTPSKSSPAPSQPPPATPPPPPSVMDMDSATAEAHVAPEPPAVDPEPPAAQSPLSALLSQLTMHPISPQPDQDAAVSDAVAHKDSSSLALLSLLTAQTAAHAAPRPVKDGHAASPALSAAPGESNGLPAAPLESPQPNLPAAPLAPAPTTEAIRPPSPPFAAAPARALPPALNLDTPAPLTPMPIPAPTPTPKPASTTPAYSVNILGINPSTSVAQVLTLFIDPVRDQFGPVRIQQLGVWRSKDGDKPARGVRFVFESESKASGYFDQVTIWDKVGVLSEVRAEGWELRIQAETV